jgi:5-methylthioadenosine/S-adenosylhomocysteine deaminase
VHAGVLHQPGQAPARSVEVSIVGDAIADVVSRPGALKVTGDSAVIGGPGSIVLPAIADAHDHGRGIPTIAYAAADQALESWLPALSGQPLIDSGVLTSFALAKLARSGVGSVVHCHNTQSDIDIAAECAAAADAARDVGVRMAVAIPLADRNRLGYGPDEAVLGCIDHAHRATVEAHWASGPRSVADQIARFDEAAAAVVASARAGEPDLVNVQYCPVGPQWCSDELMEAVAEASATSGRRVHMHLYETRYQREWAEANYPGGLLRHLDDIGLLTDRLTIAHGVWLDEAELELLAERRVIVSINTSSNLRLRSGQADVARMRRLGVRVAFGMDGMSLDDDEDTLRELQLGHLLNAGIGFDQGLAAEDVLSAATVTGPVAVSGDGRWGRIEPGAPADLMVVDGDPLIADFVDGGGVDIDALLLTRARARNVTDLVVAGRAVVGGGKVLGVDEDALAAEVAARCRAARPTLDVLAPVVAAYQDGLRRFYLAGGHQGSAASSTGP